MDMQMQEVFSRFTYGIYIVSVKVENDYNAMIASWVAQCSYEPPLLCIAIRHNRLSHEQIIKSGEFSIGIALKESGDMIRRFKIPDWKKKFEGIKTFRTQSGMLMPESITGYLDCRVENNFSTGDHTLFIGRALYGAVLKDLEPMTTREYGGCYRGDF